MQMDTDKIRVLYVDDEKPNLTNFKFLFQDNYEIYTALSAKEGLEILESTKIQIVISDQRMPDMPGIEFLARISQSYPDIVRILLTAYTDTKDILDAINIGKVYQYITKPFQEQFIKDVLNKASEICHLRKSNKDLIVQLEIKNEEYKRINEELRNSNESLLLAKEAAEESEQNLQMKNEEYEALNEELRQTNEELYLAKERAEENDRLKTAFLQNMSHEIRTPMNAIMGFSDLLSENFDDKSKLEFFSKIINQRCNDLLLIINDILDISKIESGQLPVTIEACNLNSLFTEIKLFFIEYQQKMGKQHIVFNFNMPNTPHLHTIATDKIKLKQIFINLLSNAFKFTQEGKIECGCRSDANNNIIFYVSDTGISIPSKKQEAIFERFVQLQQAPNRMQSGTGLGLPIVKGLVALLDGKIWLESQLGVGTTFYFTIPIKVPDKAVSFEERKTEDFYESDYSNYNILIVEDDDYNIKYLKEILGRINIKPVFVQYGKEGVEKAIAEHYDLILMDIGLPDMSGYEAIRQIKKEKPQVKIIAQTAYASDNDKAKAIEAGCIDYISKPLKSQILLLTIKKYLQN
jgi:signal transduction histidine kinase